MMTNLNESKTIADSHRVESAAGPIRVAITLALSSLALLGIPLATGQLAPFGLQQLQVAKSSSPSSPSTVAAETYRTTRLSTYSATQAPPAAVAPAADLEILSDFVEDGLEFTMAAAELTSPVATYKKIGHTLSWLAQDKTQPEDAPLLASQPPADSRLVALPSPSSSEPGLAMWLLPNTPEPR